MREAFDDRRPICRTGSGLRGHRRAFRPAVKFLGPGLGASGDADCDDVLSNVRWLAICRRGLAGTATPTNRGRCVIGTASRGPDGPGLNRRGPSGLTLSSSKTTNSTAPSKAPSILANFENRSPAVRGRGTCSGRGGPGSQTGGDRGGGHPSRPIVPAGPQPADRLGPARRPLVLLAALVMVAAAVVVSSVAVMSPYETRGNPELLDQAAQATFAAAGQQRVRGGTPHVPGCLDVERRRAQHLCCRRPTGPPGPTPVGHPRNRRVAVARRRMATGVEELHSRPTPLREHHRAGGALARPPGAQADARLGSAGRQPCPSARRTTRPCKPTGRVPTWV